MKSIQVYTFRTFGFFNSLNSVFNNVFVLGKLKQDLNVLFELIEKKEFDLVLGIAESNQDYSYFEPITINKFNKNKSIIKNGKFSYTLYLPNLAGTNFKMSNKPTSSFCNYSMYRIKKFILDKNLITRLSFVHIIESDLQRLLQVFYE